MTELQLNIERFHSMIRVLQNCKYKNIKDRRDSEAQIIILQVELKTLEHQQNEIEKKKIFEETKNEQTNLVS